MNEPVEHQLQTAKDECFTITSKFIGLSNTVSCYAQGHISKEDMSMEAHRVIGNIDYLEKKLQTLKINIENYISIN